MTSTERHRSLVHIEPAEVAVRLHTLGLKQSWLADAVAQGDFKGA